MFKEWNNSVFSFRMQTYCTLLLLLCGYIGMNSLNHFTHCVNRNNLMFVLNEWKTVGTTLLQILTYATWIKPMNVKLSKVNSSNIKQSTCFLCVSSLTSLFFGEVRTHTHLQNTNVYYTYIENHTHTLWNDEWIVLTIWTHTYRKCVLRSESEYILWCVISIKKQLTTNFMLYFWIWLENRYECFDEFQLEIPVYRSPNFAQKSQRIYLIYSTFHVIW